MFKPQQGLKLHDAENRLLTLDQEIGKGGEGSVWSILGDASIVAKFYHAGLTTGKATKIEAMCRLKSTSLLGISAWPLTTLKPNSFGPPAGLLMPRISGYQEAHLLYTPKSRRANFPEAQFPFIVHASINIARAFATVHEAGQVIGDVNHGNLLISQDARVALIDCDSFEIQDGPVVFPCLVGVPTYTPPELQGQSFQGVRRTKQHDAFGLAVLIFHMLFLGRHPFAGIFRGGKADKTIEDAIREYRFAYQPDNRLTELEPPPSVPRLSELPKELGQLFLGAFGRNGAQGGRPAAQDWLAPLEKLASNLKKCAANDTHHYYQELNSCPWCRVENAFGKAMFGIKFTIVSGAAFDIVAIWTQIESVQADVSSASLPSPADYAIQFWPDSRIPEIKQGRRMWRALGTGVILFAILIVAPGRIDALPSILILFAGIAAMAKLWRVGEQCASEFTSAFRTSAAEFNDALARGDSLQKIPDTFSQRKQQLQSEKQEFIGLSSLRVKRLAELTAGLREKQFTRYLERHRIDDAVIPNFGPGRKTLLRCYNVDDASDVELSRLEIKGLGPSLKAALLAWRVSIEQRFVFNAGQAIDPTDLRALDQELAQKRAKLIQSLSTGPQQLRQTLLMWQVERTRLFDQIRERAKALAQAEVNVNALGRF